MCAFRGADSPTARQARELANAGRLADVYAQAGPLHQLAIRSGVHEIACQVVFQRITLPVERTRRHFDCGLGVARMRPECLDRFHDAVEALVLDTVRRATIPILNLDAWMASRATPVTIDDHRTRRGARGAQQRPYVPQWLRLELADERWLVDLALAILTWVGIPDTAGTDLWPVDAWADRRAQVTGDHEASTPAVVCREIEQVLRAMRRRPNWYARYVERPLDHKPIAVTPAVRTWEDTFVQPPPLSLVEPDERHDWALWELAGRCLDAIRVGVALPGADRIAVVTQAIRWTFCAHPGDLAHPPHGDSDPDVERILSDPMAVARIVGTVLTILDESGPLDTAGPADRRIPAG